jgi:hypothetical protein
VVHVAGKPDDLPFNFSDDSLRKFYLDFPQHIRDVSHHILFFVQMAFGDRPKAKERATDVSSHKHRTPSCQSNEQKSCPIIMCEWLAGP